MSKKRRHWLDMMKIVTLLATAAGYLFAWLGFPETYISLICLAAVLLIARYTHSPACGRRPGAWSFTAERPTPQPSLKTAASAFTMIQWR